MFNHAINIFSIARKINRPLILDGAMGSLLQAQFEKKGSLWMSYLNIDNPDAVKRIHRGYIEAGADIITTNTFRTNPISLRENADYNSDLLVERSVLLAKEAVNGNTVLIAGSNPPAEDCYQKERTISRKLLEENHRNHIKSLWGNRVHFILNETQSHLDEIEIICKYCSEEKIPFIISVYFEENLTILSGEAIEDVINLILHYAPLAIGFNCIRPETFLKLFRDYQFSFNWGTYINCGSGNPIDESISCGISPEEYQKIMKQILIKSPSFIGACCGSSPAHIKELKRYLDERNFN